MEKTIFPEASLIQGFHEIPALGLELPVGPGLGASTWSSGWDSAFSLPRAWV